MTFPGAEQAAQRAAAGKGDERMTTQTVLAAAGEVSGGEAGHLLDPRPAGADRRRSAWSSARNAVHSALWLVLTMLCLGVFYVLQAGPFIGMAQIIVYTGAIMMLFLFVLMLVGRDASDSLIEALRGQRVAAVLLGLGFAGLVGDRPLPGAGRRRTAVGLDAGQRRGQRAGHRPAAVHQVRLRLRGHLGAADHRRDRRDGAGPRRAAQGGQDATSRDRCRPGSPRATTPARSPARASSPPRPRWPPRPGCPTAG